VYCNCGGGKLIKAIIFDFDGVLVESVDVKTEAFAQMFKDKGQEIVSKVVEYHLAHGGVSRFEKFKYFYKNFLKEELSEVKLKDLCDKFSDIVVNRVVSAPWVKGAKEFLENYKDKYDFFIASGTPENEIREIVKQRQISSFFRAVYGSPETKDQITARILSNYKLNPIEVLFVGDAPSDLKAARTHGIRFIARVNSCGYNPFNDVDFPIIHDLEKLADVISKLTLKG